MCLLIETIKVLDRHLQNIEYHNQRFNNSGKSLFGIESSDLRQHIIIPENLDDDLYKCRVIYTDRIISVEFEKYEVKPIKTLKLIECNTIEYNHKFCDRQIINELYGQKQNCDDILLIKNGMVTDTSYCNIAFLLENQWFTPALPLLQGTKRAKLIEEKVIIERNIYKEELKLFSKACLFNAMIDFGEIFIEADGLRY